MILVLCREVEFINPFQYKERTKKSGKAWEDIASNLRKHGYDVEKRAVRDKYNKIKDGIQKKNAKELRESGIAPELTNDELEITQIVEDMQEVEKETKEQQGEVRAEEEKKQHDGVEMRQRALETFTETNKRYWKVCISEERDYTVILHIGVSGEGRKVGSWRLKIFHDFMKAYVI